MPEKTETHSYDFFDIDTRHDDARTGHWFGGRVESTTGYCCCGRDDQFDLSVTRDCSDHLFLGRKTKASKKTL